MIEIIVNTHNENSLSALDELIKEFSKRKIEYKISKTSKEKNATILMDEVEGDELIVIGGDGTINEVVNNYHGEEIIYIARGSGNDLARSLKLKNTTLEIIQKTKKPEVFEYDVGEVSGKYFCTGLDVGFNADVIKRVEGSPFKSRFRKNVYLICGIMNILNLKKYHAEILIDDKEKIITKSLYLLNIMLQPYEGGGIKFAPKATGIGGEFSVLIMENMSYMKFIYNYLCILFKKHEKMRGVKLLKAKKITVKTNQSHYQMDGELVEYKKQLNIKCLERFYKIKQ